MMRIITTRDIIRKVVETWDAHYGRYPSDSQFGLKFHAIGRRLHKLNLETATHEDVERIIGNRSWTTQQCRECQAFCDTLIQLGDVPDYESATTELCLPCLEKAYHLMRAIPA